MHVSSRILSLYLYFIIENSKSGSTNSRKRPGPLKTNPKAKRPKALDKNLQAAKMEVCTWNGVLAMHIPWFQNVSISLLNYNNRLEATSAHSSTSWAQAPTSQASGSQILSTDKMDRVIKYLRINM